MVSSSGDIQSDVFLVFLPKVLKKVLATESIFLLLDGWETHRLHFTSSKRSILSWS